VLTERTQRVLISPQAFINLKKTAMSVEPQPVNDVTHLTHRTLALISLLLEQVMISDLLLVESKRMNE